MTDHERNTIEWYIFSLRFVANRTHTESVHERKSIKNDICHEGKLFKSNVD